MARIARLAGTTALLLLSALPLAAQIRASPESAPSDCDDWKAGSLSRFFQSATVADVDSCLRAGADIDTRDDANRTPLHWASLHAQSPDLLAFLLAAGADIHARDWGHVTPLHEAAQNRNPDIATALVEAGADVNARDARDRTPLHAAWGNPNPAVVHTLLELGADRLARDDRGTVADPAHCEYWNTPNFARVADTLAVKGCMESGADLLARKEVDSSPFGEKGGNTPLHHAARYGAVANVALFLNAGVEVDVRNGGGQTPLHLAASNENPAVAALLLEAGADVDAREEFTEERYASTGVAPNHNRTPLHYAASNPNSAVAAMLLEAGAAVNPRDGDAQTPLHRAAGSNNAAVATLLLAAGAEVNARDVDGVTPLLLAGSWGGGGRFRNPALADALLDAGADASIVAGYWGRSALHSAVIMGGHDAEAAVRLVAGLLQAGADPDGRADGGHTPLHYAARLKSQALITTLLAAFPDVNARDEDARAPLHVAAESAEDAAAVEALLQAGAEVDARDSNGETPLHLAVGASVRWADGILLWIFRRPGGTGGPQANPAVLALLRAGADVNARNHAGDTPLHHAVSQGNPFHVAVLLNAGADVNALNESGDSPLHEAASRRATAEEVPSGAEIVTALFDAGADLNARNAMGETPLHVAGKVYNPSVRARLLELGADGEARDHLGRNAGSPVCEWPDAQFINHAPPESVQGCLAFGADVNAQDENGNTPLHFVAGATRPNYFASTLIGILAEAGSDVNARDARGDTPLHRAASNARHDLAAALLAAGADPDARDESGRAALHRAVRAWIEPVPVPIVSTLVDAGASLDAVDDEGRTPLHMALDRGMGAVVERLLEHGGDWASRVEINHAAGATHCGRWNTPAFFRIATAGVVAACIRQGADVNVRLEGRTWTRPAGGPAPLHLAAQWTRDPAVIPVLVRSGANVNARDDRNNAPLHLAVRHNPDPAVAAALLEAGAEVNAWATGFFIDYGWDYTPLHEAVVHKNPDVTATLLQAGADVHAGVGFHPRDRRGVTPIHAAAARADDPVTISLLVRAGADVNVPTNNGHTPLHEAAATNNNPAIIETLVEAGADVNARAAGGRTPLHMAAAGNSNPAVVSALLKAGAGLHALTATGSTALLEAASGNRNPAVLESLVGAGANVGDRDELGRTPLHVAALRNAGVFPALLRLGADLTARDDAGGTPLDYARTNKALQGLEVVWR